MTKIHEDILDKINTKLSGTALRDWRIWQLIDLASTIFLKISALILLLVIIAIWYQICARVAHFSVIGITESGGYLLIWISWFAMASNLKKDRHIKVDIILRKMSVKLQAFFSIISNVICLIFSGIMMFASMRIVNMYYVLNEKSLFLNIHIFIVYTALPVGLLLFGLVALREIVFTMPLFLTKQSNTIKENL